MVANFDEWLPQHIDDANALRLNEIVVPASPETSLGLIDLLRAWWEHLSKFEEDLRLPQDDRSIWGAHDYIAALILRDLLAKAISHVEPSLRDQIDAAVSEVDQRFNEFTESDHDGCTERVDGRVDPSRGWWWQRVPKRGPIRDELQLHYGHSASE